MTSGSKSEDVVFLKTQCFGPDLYSKYASPFSGLISSLLLFIPFYADDSQIWTSLNARNIENQNQVVLKL